MHLPPPKNFFNLTVTPLRTAWRHASIRSLEASQARSHQSVHLVWPRLAEGPRDECAYQSIATSVMLQTDAQ